MTDVLPWAWVLPLPGLALTALGVSSRRPGLASQFGPALLFVAALFGLLGGVSADLRLEGWVPFVPDGALHLRVDTLALVMLALVGGVSTAIYVYSLAYLSGDPGQRRFFVYLDFFVAAMALLVLAGNLATLLVGWAGVGLASFLLISFWRERAGTLRAGLEALAANAVGDAALLLAVVLVPAGCGPLATLHEAECTGGIGGAGLLAALLVIAAAAKSAQGPLYFWLPSAMAGPTPVSALLHSATMVAAGVYLLVRVEPLLALAPNVLLATAIVGVATALLGGLASLQQTNVKRAIAYSTVSQLGYMFAAVGLLAPFAAFFHLMSQAMFKALLFLSAGVAVHAGGGDEEMGRLGGLRKVVPVAYFAFLAGALSLIGIPGTAGAFSKDLVIEAGLARNLPIGLLLLGGTFITGLYIGRVFFAVFHGPRSQVPAPRSQVPGARSEVPGPAAHPASTVSDEHGPSDVGRGRRDMEPGASDVGHGAWEARLLVWPLVPLALGALLLGYLEWPFGVLSSLLVPVIGEAEAVHLISPVGLAAAGLGLAGFLAAGWWQQRRRLAPEGRPARTAWVDALAEASNRLARGVAGVHSGHLARYAFATTIGVAVILFLGLRP